MAAWKGLFTLIVIAAAQASHNFDHNPSSQYTFSQSVSLDPEDPVQPLPPTLPSTSSSMVCSTLICDGEFLVSAMMINGGDLHQTPGRDFEDSDDDNDNNDDDDDGHSSMLSNTSLRRSVATANAGSALHSSYGSAENSSESSASGHGVTASPAFVGTTQRRIAVVWGAPSNGVSH
jgi:hypothetical protein